MELKRMWQLLMAVMLSRQVTKHSVALDEPVLLHKGLALECIREMTYMLGPNLEYYKSRPDTAIYIIPLQQRGTATATAQQPPEAIPEETDDRWLRPALNPETPGMQQYQLSLESPEPKRRRRKRAIRWIVYDPAKHPMQNDCFYAALAFVEEGRAPSRERMNQIRRRLCRWYQNHDSIWELVAQAEKVEKQQYLKQFVAKGWGGQPELMAWSQATGIGMQVADLYGNVMFATKGEQTSYCLILHEQHYMVGNSEMLRPNRAHQQQ